MTRLIAFNAATRRWEVVNEEDEVQGGYLVVEEVWSQRLVCWGSTWTVPFMVGTSIRASTAGDAPGRGTGTRAPHRFLGAGLRHPKAFLRVGWGRPPHATIGPLAAVKPPTRIGRWLAGRLTCSERRRDEGLAVQAEVVPDRPSAHPPSTRWLQLPPPGWPPSPLPLRQGRAAAPTRRLLQAAQHPARQARPGPGPEGWAARGEVEGGDGRATRWRAGRHWPGLALHVAPPPPSPKGQSIPSRAGALVAGSQIFERLTADDPFHTHPPVAPSAARSSSSSFCHPPSRLQIFRSTSLVFAFATLQLQSRVSLQPT